MRYNAKFNGRRINAIGIFYDIETTVTADDEKSAELKLYDSFDHITRLKLTPIPPNHMRAIRVTFDDSDTLETNINGTDDEIRRYYIGTSFSFWVGGDIGEGSHIATNVEFLDSQE